MTITEITATEPRVAALLDDVQPATDLHEQYREWGRVKRGIADFVGWSAPNPALRTEQAYHTVQAAVLARIGL